jgi:uncharacterized phage infection (PIP) family protein YhgE
MTQNIASDLLKMKEEAQQAKTKLDETKGKLKGHYERLEKDFGCKTLEEADKKLNIMDKELDKKEKKLEDGYNKLKDEINAN